MTAHKKQTDDPHRCICGAEWVYEEDWDGCAFFAGLTPIAVKV